MRLLTCAVIVWSLSVASAAAQSADPVFPVAGTVIKVSPVFVPREDSRTLVVILPADTPIQVLGRDGFWYKVVFASPQGDRTGLMEPHDIRIDADAPTLSSPRGSAVFSERGLVELRGFGFPETAANDVSRALGDALLRQEAFVRPARWVQFALGLDLRGSSQDEVEEEWRLDLEDRGVLRPRAAVRRLGVALTSRYVSLDLGKQFIRWGRTDILSPVDRFAPRDYLNVLDSEFLPVLGARASIRAGGETFELVWVPQMTPSRLPLLGRRWTIVPPEVAGFTLEDHGSVFPDTSEQGFRWSHSGRFEMGLSVFDGFNHLPDINAAIDLDSSTVALTRTYSALRTYGGELSIPTPAFTLKGEAAWFTSPDSTSEEYVLYVVEAERQMGEWLLDAGYTGEVVTTARALTPFAAERGVAHSIIGRASYTIDPRRSIEIEGAARRNGRGLYAKGEYSQTFGRHWRLTLAAAGIGGKDDDFLGQYQRNSHASATLRLSY
jgi:hypothetical protein